MAEDITDPKSYRSLVFTVVLVYALSVNDKIHASIFSPSEVWKFKYAIC